MKIFNLLYLARELIVILISLGLGYSLGKRKKSGQNAKGSDPEI